MAKAVREGLTTSLPAWLADADLDLPVMSLLVKRAEFVSEPLLSERMLLAAPTRHWLWRQRRPVTFRDFVTEPLLLLKDGHCFGDDVLEICRRFRCDPHVAFEGGQFDILAAVVATGAGVTLLPETDRYRFRRMGLGLLDFVPPQPVRRIGIAPLKHKFLTPAGRALIVVLRGACRGPEARGRTKSTCA